MNQGSLELALTRFASMLRTAGGDAAASAISEAATTLGNDLEALLEQHAAQRQFVHGVGPLYVAKTRNPGQFPDWNEIINKPSGIGSSIDMDSIEIDASQVVSGVFLPGRLPFANHGEEAYNKAVRANDPRLAVRTISATTGAPLAAGDFVAVIDDAGTAKVVPAQSSVHLRGTLGFTPESKGTNETVLIYPYGENTYAPLSGVTVADLGRTVFLSNTPGKVTLTPPSSGLLQPLGAITQLLPGGVVGVMVRYEFRFLL